MILIEGLLDHADSFLLVAQGGKSTEGHVISPVEASEILRVLHPLRPVGLRLEILRDLPTLQLVLLIRLLVLHQRAIQHVHFVRLMRLLRLHLLD